MDEKQKKSVETDDAELEREVRSNRKYSLAEAIGRLGGDDLLKGQSPVTRKRQAELEIEQYLERHLTDVEGALEVVLLRRVRESAILLKTRYDHPLDALAQFVERILSSQQRLRDFVTAVDAEWGRIYLERPRIQKEGQSPDEGDPYTFSSVRTALEQLLRELRGK